MKREQDAVLYPFKQQKFKRLGQCYVIPDLNQS